MKINSHSLSLALVASPVAAFPSVLLQRGLSDIDLKNISAAAIQSIIYGKPAQENPPFDAASQYVSTTGIHAWKAPGLLDQRGPCPGLNALANHGYLPRTGIASLADFVIGTKMGVGMDEGLSAILAAYGGILDGLLGAWSIGGGIRTGIGGSHNNYESDSSPFMGDLSQYGSNSGLIMAQFLQLYNMQPDAATANYDLNVLAQFRKQRFADSVQKNPQFTYVPFAGTAVTQAAFAFIYRFMANKTAEHPAGILNKQVLKSWFSIYGPEDNLRWVPGHERIPDNWYRRNDDDLYGLSALSTDFGVFFKVAPEASQAGCNNGTVNSFQNITANDSGSNSGAGPNQSNMPAFNPLCYGLVQLSNTISPVDIVNSVVNELILPAQGLLGCQVVPEQNMTLFEACPGYSLYGGPTGPVAAGAVQS